LKVTNEKTENSQAFLTIEIESEEMEESAANVYRRLVKQVNVPGFRKGKAPRAVLERHIGRERLLESLLDDVVPRFYEKAVEQEELDAIAQPQIDIEQTDPVIFKAVVPLKPVVTLGDYHGIRMEPEPVEVAQETVDAVVEQLRHQHATWEPAERAVELGDLAALDVESTLDGEPFINQQGAQYQVVGESSAPAPGFAEQIVGMARDEEKEFEIEFPEDFARTEVAGKKAAFKVKVTEVKAEILPEVTDEFAAQVDAEFETADAMKERILADLRSRAEEREKQAFEDRVIDALVDVSEAAFPPLLVESEIHRMLEDQERRLQMQGLSMEQYMRMMDKTHEQLHEDLHPEAEKRVTRSLALGRLSEDEKIEVAEADIDAEAAAMIEQAADERKEDMRKVLSTPDAQDSLRQTLLSRRTVQRIVDIATGSTESSESTESVDPAESASAESAGSTEPEGSAAAGAHTPEKEEE
jgi:trigger factor